MKYFTSDLHFHHPFVAALRGYARPGFETVGAEALRELRRAGVYSWEEMVDWQRHDDDIVAGINATVGEGDDLYVLGDIGPGGTRALNVALERLRTVNVPRERLHLVLGNHEQLEPGDDYMNLLLTVFNDVAVRGRTTIDGLGEVELSHFQFAAHFNDGETEGMSQNAKQAKYRQYAFEDDGSTYLLHGHTHARTPYEFDNPRELNIGVDAWGMKPVAETRIVEAFHDFHGAVPKEAADDGHPTLTILRGFPASGKSTWARQQAGPATVIVNLDSMREMMMAHRSTWHKHATDAQRELLMDSSRHLMREALGRGLNVISDAMHVNPAYVSEEIELARQCGAHVQFRDFLDVPLDELLRRNAERDREERVPPDFLKRTYKKGMKMRGNVASSASSGSAQAAVAGGGAHAGDATVAGNDIDVTAVPDDGNLLHQMERNEYVRVKPVAGDDGVYACNFTRDAFFNHVWNQYTSTARGLFLDEDGNVVMRGFEKFFNLEENRETSLPKVLESIEYPVRVERKENGFLGLVGLNASGDGLRFYSKSGVTDYSALIAQQVMAALGRVEGSYERLLAILRAHGVTLAFEIIDNESDRHIIRYEHSQAVFLHAIRNEKTFSIDYGAERDVDALGVFARPETVAIAQNEYALLEQIDEARHSDREGVVLYGANGYMVKIKSDLYLKSKSVRRILEQVLLSGKPRRTDRSERTRLANEILDNLSREQLVYTSALKGEEKIDMIPVTAYLTEHGTEGEDSGSES